MRIIRPDFKIPHDWCNTILSTIAPTCIFVSIGLVICATYRIGGRRRRILLASLGCFLLFLAASGMNYALFHLVQVPAFQRYVMIESRDWLTRVGNPAPDITVEMLDDSHVQLSELRGKVILLNFFATWCGPCETELPHLQELWNDLKTNDRFRMFIVGRNESLETVAEFQSKNGFSFPMVVDPDGSAFSKFAKEGIPRTYLISPEGAILFQSFGFADIDLYQREMKTLRRLIDEELGKKP